MDRRQIFGVIDTETTFQVLANGSVDPMPYNSDNWLVSVGYAQTAELEDPHYECVQHNYQKTSDNWDVRLQKFLYNIDVLVAHNAKFDIVWLLENGFDIPENLWDTMLVEWVLCHHNATTPLDLSSCCKRWGIPTKKDAEIKKYLDKKIGFEEIPWPLVEEYGKQDVTITGQLFLRQFNRLYPE